MTTVVVLGLGHIGYAVEYFAKNLVPFGSVITVDATNRDATFILDLTMMTSDEIEIKLRAVKATVVINCLPFFLNEKIAKAARAAICNYIDFTEDDVMADKVQAIYNGTGLYCAVKCGLAPGFINYVGKSLVEMFDKPESLMISVGALPRNVNWRPGKEHLNYNLTWSVDGLVNEYIRPCRIRSKGVEKEIAACTGIETIIADGVQYEAAYTSGGIGSLAKDLKHVPNVAYKTLRYPGHYSYVVDALTRNNRDFDRLKKEFLDIFPYTSNDIIVVYAEATGKTNGKFTRETFSAHFVGVEGLTAIQSTTAGAGVAMLEMFMHKNVAGVVNHSDVDFAKFKSTDTFSRSYITR